MTQDNFTYKVQEVIQKAQELAKKNQHPQIESEHLLKAIAQHDEGVLPFVLQKIGIESNALQSFLDETMNKFPKVTGGEVSFSRACSQIFSQAERLSKKTGDQYISVEYLLLAIFESNGAITDFIKKRGVKIAQIKSAIEELRKGAKITSQSGDQTYHALNKYAKNLNELAIQGKLDPVIGRDDEIRRVLQILSRRTKNNPMLIGEPGVGKTAIAEGLAHRIIEGDVPENLKEIQIFALDMGSLIAGAKYKGEFEERLKSVVKEVVDEHGNIVLFIDEIHTLVGAGGGEGAMDAANILKPALARGELRSIGATTLDEYQKYFEKDKALERRFQKIYIEEPDNQDAIAILRGIKEKYEAHHKVRIKDEAIISAVELSQRYITNRFLPDKAIDLIDEASSKIRMEINSKPEELDILDRKIMQLEIAVVAIKKENDKKKLVPLQEELAELKEKRNSLFAKWKSEKDIVDDIQQTKKELENAKIEADKAEREGDYGKVAEIRYGKMEQLNAQLEKSQKSFAANEQNNLIKEEVTSEDIAETVAKWTGIPVAKMLQSNQMKLLKLEDELYKRVVGQEEAVEAVSNAIRISRSGLQDPTKPIGSFLFLGTTGVGKTELAKTLANYLFDDDKAMVRIDMSEYQEKHSVSRLVGAPPGYVGYDEGGQLTEAVRRKPYSVILLDEIEKAHPDVFNILLQVLDDGRLTDNKGRIADFKNTIIIMTSNMGSQQIQSIFESDKAIEDKKVEAREKVLEELKQQVRSEFLNRIDNIILFTPLDKNDVAKIVRIQLDQLSKMLLEQNIEIKFSEEVVGYIADKGFDPVFGARPIKRAIQKEVLNVLSVKILSGEIQTNTPINASIKSEGLIFEAA